MTICVTMLWRLVWLLWRLVWLCCCVNLPMAVMSPLYLDVAPRSCWWARTGPSPPRRRLSWKRVQLVLTSSRWHLKLTPDTTETTAWHLTPLKQQLDTEHHSIIILPIFTILEVKVYLNALKTSLLRRQLVDPSQCNATNRIKATHSKKFLHFSINWLCCPFKFWMS